MQNEPTPLDYAIKLQEMEQLDEFRKQLWDPDADKREREAERERKARQVQFDLRCHATESTDKNGITTLTYDSQDCGGELLN